MVNDGVQYTHGLLTELPRRSKATTPEGQPSCAFLGSDFATHRNDAISKRGNVDTGSGRWFRHADWQGQDFPISQRIRGLQAVEPGEFRSRRFGLRSCGRREGGTETAESAWLAEYF